MSNTFDMEPIMPSLSYQEKSLYGSLAAELIIYGSYFFLHGHNSVGKVVVMIFSIILLQIILQSLIAAFTRNRRTDERDKLIELRGYRAGYFTVITLMVVGLGMLWLHVVAGRFPINSPWIALHFLSVFFGILVIADIVKTVTQIFAYRRAI
jgi:hypothetical protein